MKKNIRIAMLASGVGVVLLTGWLGASVYVGHRAEIALQKLVQDSIQSHSYRLRNLRHQSGLLSSSGQVELALVDTCDTSSHKPEHFSATISYQLSHLVAPTSLLRAEWSVTPTGDSKAGFDALFGGQVSLQGKGRMRLSGVLQSDMNLPAINLVRSGETLVVSPSTGTIAVGNDTLDFDWKTNKLTYRGNGMAMAIEGLGVQSDMTSVKRGLGSFALSIDKFGNSTASAEGMRLAMEVVEKNDRLDMSITPSVKALNAGDKQFSDMLLEIAINGMQAKSIEYLIDLSQKSCDFRNLTQDEEKRMRENVRELLFKGMSVGIHKIAGKVDGGMIDGNLMIEIGKTDGASFALEKVLTSRGELNLIGAGIKQDDKKMLVSRGIANETPDGVNASFDYAAGILKVNGKVFDATMFDNLLQGVNAGITSFLTGAHEKKAQVTVSEEPAEADDTAEPENEIRAQGDKDA